MTNLSQLHAVAVGATMAIASIAAAARSLTVRGMLVVVVVVVMGHSKVCFCARRTSRSC